MFLENLADHVLYNLCKYLSFIDIINLSKIFKQFYILIEKVRKSIEQITLYFRSVLISY